jgi:hypothetical protein
MIVCPKATLSRYRTTILLVSGGLSDPLLHLIFNALARRTVCASFDVPPGYFSWFLILSDLLFHSILNGGFIWCDGEGTKSPSIIGSDVELIILKTK